MARPQKQRVDYFPHDVGASQDRIPSILYNHFKHEGISLWWQLQEVVSGTENHIIIIETPTDLEFLAQKLRFMPDRLVEILDKCAELGFIDTELWKSKVIWCQTLVQDLANVYANRNRPLPMKPVVSRDETGVITVETVVSTTQNPQSKVKYSKVEDSKGKESKENSTETSYYDIPDWLLLLTSTFPTFTWDIQWVSMIEKEWVDIDLSAMTQEFVSYWEGKTNNPPVIRAQFIKSLGHARDKGQFKVSKSKDDPNYYRDQGPYTDIIQR